MKPISFVFLSMLLFAGLAYCAPAIQNVTSCINITGSGEYRLISDLAGAPNPGSPFFDWACIMISTSNVILDCQGHSLTGTGFGAGVNAYEGLGPLRGIMVKNCHITGYDYGIGFEMVNNSYIEENTLFDNNMANIRLEDRCNDNQITDNIAYGARDCYQVVTNSNRNLLASDIAHDCDYGFSIYNSLDNNITSCTAYRNPEYGFFERFGFGGPVGTVATTILDSRFYDNGWEIGQASAYGHTFTMTNTTLGSRSVTISLTDRSTSPSTPVPLPAYTINETYLYNTPPDGYMSFLNKYIKVYYDEDILLDSLTFHYTAAEIAPYNESSLKVFVWDGTAWVEPSQTFDMRARTINLAGLTNLTLDDYYGLFVEAIPSEPDDDGAGRKMLDLSASASCDGISVSVESGGEPIDGASVVAFDAESLYDMASGRTVDGTYSFDACDRTVRVRASKEGYSSDALTITSVPCVQCLPGKACKTDGDCPSDQTCAGQRCAELDCGCGYPEGHQCVPLPCCSDLDCQSGERCLDNDCVPECIPPVCCTSSGQCAGIEYCTVGATAAEGSCQPVAGCGEAKDHALVPYECGTAPGCPSCPQGEYCVSDICSSGRLSASGLSAVGEELEIDAEADGSSCGGCQIQVTDPSGARSTLTTDPSGKAFLPLSKPGKYSLALLKDGMPIGTLDVDAASAGDETPEPPVQGGPDLVPIVGGLLLLGTIALGVFYLLGKGAKK
ncbi:MAG: right-handed parallel beta-helix repeat-containing protein [Candidatus Micrarchaeota archaeon]